MVEMTRKDYVNALKGVPAKGLYYFGMECGGPLYSLFRDYIEYLLIYKEVWVDDIKDVVVEEEEHKVCVTIEYSFNDFVDIFDEDDDTKLLGRVKIEFDDEQYYDEPYGYLDLKDLAEKIVDMFSSDLEDRLDHDIEDARRRIKETEEADEYKDRYGVEDE